MSCDSVLCYCETKTGETGPKKRGANQIEDRLQESYRSKAIRDSNSGARWLWGKHEKKIKTWIDKERMRSHTVGLVDVRDEWIDMIEEEIQEIRSSGVMSKDEELWVMELEKTFP